MSWKREDETHLALEGDDLVVRRYQDAEDIAERAKMLREQPQHKDFHHKWSLPNVMVDAFYQEYNGGWKNSLGPPKPMNQEFWAWVHLKMKDPQYQKFWCHDNTFQHRIGYQGVPK